MPSGLHTLHYRLDDFAHRLGVQSGTQSRGRRVSAHPAGIGAAIAIEQALVVLTGGERQHVVAIHHHDEARFLASK